MKHEMVQRLEWGHSNGRVGSWRSDDFVRAKSRPYCLKCGATPGTGMTYDDWAAWNAECLPPSLPPKSPPEAA